MQKQIQKNIRYINHSSPIDIKNITDSFNHSQLFQGIIKSNNIIQNDYIYGRINGVNMYFSNIRAESELKHSWRNPLDIPSITILQEDTSYSNWYFLYHFTIYILCIFFSNQINKNNPIYIWQYFSRQKY